MITTEELNKIRVLEHQIHRLKHFIDRTDVPSRLDWLQLDIGLQNDNIRTEIIFSESSQETELVERFIRELILIRKDNLPVLEAELRTYLKD